MRQTFLASLARIADFDRNPFDVRPFAHEHWDNGDYVLAQVTGTPSVLYQVETCSGSMVPVKPGDQIIGALGHRQAIARALERVREGADVMPASQLMEAIELHLGKNWRAPNGFMKDGGDVEVIAFSPEPPVQPLWWKSKP